MKRRRAVYAVCIAIALLATTPILAGADENVLYSKGNLKYNRKGEPAIEFYSSDITNMGQSMQQLQEIISGGRGQIVAALNTRGISTADNATFTSMSGDITAVEQKVFIGVQKRPAKITYQYHHHTYNGEPVNDYYNSAIYETANGCYTKEVYQADGKLKGYMVGCDYVENQIIAADVVEIQ